MRYATTPIEGEKVRHIPYGEYELTIVAVPWEDGTFTFGVSVRSPKDQNNRKLGLEIARGRVRKASWLRGRDLVEVEKDPFLTSWEKEEIVAGSCGVVGPRIDALGLRKYGDWKCLLDNLPLHLTGESLCHLTS